MSERILKNAEVIDKRLPVEVVNSIFRSCEISNSEYAEFVLSATEKLQVKKCQNGDYEMTLFVMKPEA